MTTMSIKSGSNDILDNEYETLDIIDINSKNSNYITIDKIQFKKTSDKFTDLTNTSFQTLSVGSDVSFNMIDIIVGSNVELEIKKNDTTTTSTLTNILLFKRPSIIYNNSDRKKTSQIHFVFKDDTNGTDNYRHIIHELEPVISRNSSPSSIVNSILDNLMDIIYETNNDSIYKLKDDTLKTHIRNILNDKNNLVNSDKIIEIEPQSDNDEIIINLTNILPNKYEVSHDKVYKSINDSNNYYYIENSKLSYDNMYFILFKKNNIVEFDETPVNFTQESKKNQIGINEGEYNNNMNSEKPNTPIVERNENNNYRNIGFVTCISLSILFALISINISYNNSAKKMYYGIGFLSGLFFFAGLGLYIGFSFIKH